jgi:hypothetical protein
MLRKGKQKKTRVWGRRFSPEHEINNPRPLAFPNSEVCPTSFWKCHALFVVADRSWSAQFETLDVVVFYEL